MIHIMKWSCGEILGSGLGGSSQGAVSFTPLRNNVQSPRVPSSTKQIDKAMGKTEKEVKKRRKKKSAQNERVPELKQP